MRNPELDAQIRSAPDGIGPYLVYADWLEERGDPRAELIRVQLAIEAAPDDPLLRQRESEWLRAHGEALIGPLTWWMRRPDDHKALTWHRGFVRHATLQGRLHLVSPLQTLLDAHASLTLSGLTLGRLGEPFPVDLLCRRSGLQHLDVDGQDAEDLPPAQWERLLDAGLQHLRLRSQLTEQVFRSLAAATGIDRLRSLHLNTWVSSDTTWPTTIRALTPLHHLQLTVEGGHPPIPLTESLKQVFRDAQILQTGYRFSPPVTLLDVHKARGKVPCPHCAQPLPRIRVDGDRWLCERCGRSFEAIPLPGP